MFSLDYIFTITARYFWLFANHAEAALVLYCPHCLSPKPSPLLRSKCILVLLVCSTPIQSLSALRILGLLRPHAPHLLIMAALEHHDSEEIGPLVATGNVGWAGALAGGGTGRWAPLGKAKNYAVPLHLLLEPIRQISLILFLL